MTTPQVPEPQQPMGPNWKNPVHVLAFGFGAGASPKAPGTLGTLVAIPLFLLCAELSLPVYLAVTLLGSLLGIWICGKTSADMGVHDHGGIVWDEIAGFFVTMIALPVNLYTVVTGFLLFRLFDIAKPWPIRWLDSKVGGGLGIMIDDLVAGLLACGCLHLLNHYLLAGL